MCLEKAVDSAQYRVTPRSIILRGVNFGKLAYLGENEIKFENIFTSYSVAKAESNYEINRAKISY